MTECVTCKAQSSREARGARGTPRLGARGGGEGEGWCAGSFHGVGGGVRLQDWLRWFACVFPGVVCRGDVQYPAFAPGTLFLAPALRR